MRGFDWLKSCDNVTMCRSMQHSSMKIFISTVNLSVIFVTKYDAGLDGFSCELRKLLGQRTKRRISRLIEIVSLFHTVMHYIVLINRYAIHHMHK